MTNKKKSLKSFYQFPESLKAYISQKRFIKFCCMKKELQPAKSFIIISFDVKLIIFSSLSHINHKFLFIVQLIKHKDKYLIILDISH